MGIPTVPCLDASLSKEQVFAHLQQSGKDLQIVLYSHSKFHPLHHIWAQLIWSGDTDLIKLPQKDALWKFDIRYRKQSRILQRALFFICESTGDLKYFVNGLKYFADILIKDGDDAIKITQENQPLRTIPGLMNFVESAEDLFDSKDLTRQEHATLVIAIFAGHTMIEALQHLFQNLRFHFECTPDEFHAENSFHLRDLVRFAKKLGLRMPQDSSMLKKSSSTDVTSPSAAELIINAIAEFYRVEAAFDGKITDDVVRTLTKANAENLDVVISENLAHQQLKLRAQLILAMIRQLDTFEERFGVPVPDSVIESLDSISLLKGKAYGEIMHAAEEKVREAKVPSFEIRRTDLRAKLADPEIDLAELSMSGTLSAGVDLLTNLFDDEDEKVRVAALWLKAAAYIERPDPVTEVTREFVCVLDPYDGANIIQTKRAIARRVGSTYAYDFLRLLEVGLIQEWDTYLTSLSEPHFPSMPTNIFEAQELLEGADGDLVPGKREIGTNKVGMVAWLVNMKIPEYPSGRIVFIYNDVTVQSGSFGVPEDELFFKASKFARMNKIPRVYISCNYGARIGLVENLKPKFNIKFVDDATPSKEFKNLYLTDDVHKALHEGMINVEKVPEGWANKDIIGTNEGIGVENLQGRGKIAGETSRAYDEIFTLSYVTGRSVGIGAYLVRLGQRVIQMKQGPMLLTGYGALNKLLGREVYTSNDQLGGPQVMYPIGCTHEVVDDDQQGVRSIIQWLSFVPKTTDATPAVRLSSDPVNRDVARKPTPTPYDPRLMLSGTDDAGGFFDKGSFKEYLPGWVKSVFMGRGRLGGIPMGVIAVETRLVERIIPADPADPNSRESVMPQAGQILFPDSSYRTPPDTCEAKPPMLATCDWDERGAESIQRQYVKIKAPGGGCVDMNSLIAKGIGIKTSPSSLAQRSRASAILATITDKAEGGAESKAVGLEPSLLHCPTLEVVLNNSSASWGFRPSSWNVVAKIGTMKMLEATQNEERGISADAANAGIPTGSVGDYLSKAILVLLCLASSTWHATVEALFLHPEYNRSSVKGFDNCDVGTTMKKEPRNTRRATLKVTSNRFKRNLFAVMIQVLVLIGLVRGQAGKDTIMSNEHPIRNDEQTMQNADNSDATHILHASTHGSANNQAFVNDFKDVVKSKSNLRKQKNDLDVAFSELDDGLMFGLSDEIDTTLSNIRRYSPDDIESAPEAFRASALALSQIKDYINNSDVIASLPSSFQPLFNILLQELSMAETQAELVEGLISKFYIPDKSKSDATTAVSRERVLSSPKSSSKKGGGNYNLGISQADYHLRARSRVMQTHHNIDNAFGHQQGYHGARHSRSNGGRHRRLAEDDTTCASVSEYEHKKEQCLRLAACAGNYNLYDMFVFFFGDDINFDTGIVANGEAITVYDEIDLVGKLNNITILSGDILGGIENIDDLIETAGRCDQLLQEFHRFDEGLSVAGKWQGGTVTGVCRGWGTSKFLALQSMYQITKKALSPDSQVESCVRGILEVFNRDPDNFDTVLPQRFNSIREPWKPCYEEAGKIQVEGTAISIDERLNIVNNIKDRFKCLYYSYKNRVLGEAPIDMTLLEVGDDTTFCGSYCIIDNRPCTKFCPDENPNCCECQTTDNPYCCISRKNDFLNEPLFLTRDEDATQGGLGPGEEITNNGASFFFDYKYPVELPSRVERFQKGWVFNYDVILELDSTAENLVIAVFDEFLGCANDLVKLTARDGRQIFSSGIQSYNPYTPQSVIQFQIPKTVTSFTDKFGRLTSPYLDQIFDYVPVETSNNKVIRYGDSLIGDNFTLTPKLSPGLKEWLADRFKDNDLFDAQYKFFKKCTTSDCQSYFEKLKTQNDDYFKKGLNITSLDTSIALIFGKKTTIGQVCSFAKGLKKKTVDDVPGFCCLDAPYESTEWGEKFSCTKYEQSSSSDLSSEVVQKSSDDCKMLGPVTAGFNGAACDIFHGTWCPTPRDCSALVQCIANAAAKVQFSTDRKAFFEYLNGAPKVKPVELGNPTKCAKLREYFDYDPDYPDDERICAEVRNLQCYTDFSNLDGFATGTAGGGKPKLDPSSLPQISVKTDIKQMSLERFDETANIAWSTSNQVLSKASDFITNLSNQVDIASKVCITLVSFVPGTASPCVVPFMVSLTILAITRYVLLLASVLSSFLYQFIVVGQNNKHERQRQEYTLANVDIVHGNIIANFNLAQQLKLLLGGVLEAMPSNNGEDDETRRRLAAGCEDPVNDNECSDPNSVSCTDQQYLCDGSVNWNYVALLKFAGCDSRESDGNDAEAPDICEDRYKPSLLVRDPVLFRGDDNDTTRLVYREKVFNSELSVFNFLEYQFSVNDDCQGAENLQLIIEPLSGSCRETNYTVRPLQNIPACNGRNSSGPPLYIPFQNPLRGEAAIVTVQLDYDPPVIQCGFHRECIPGINVVSPDGRTLYHYRSKQTDISDYEWNKAKFFYNVVDNCEADVQIDVVVATNELDLHNNKVAKLIEYGVAGSVREVEFLYDNYSCENTDTKIQHSWPCEKDPTVGDLSFRYYNITVSGTDSAGNVGRDNCKVIIMPNCYPKEAGCEDDRIQFGRDYRFYPTMSEVENTILRSQPSRLLYGIVESKLHKRPQPEYIEPTCKPTSTPTSPPTSRPSTSRPKNSPSTSRPTTSRPKKPTNVF